MKTVPALARTLPIVAAIGLCATLLSEPATAARVGGGGRVVAAGGWHGGPGHYRGGHWGHRGYYWPGAFWGGIGLGLGIGAVGYYGGYYGDYWGPAYRSYYYDPPLVVAPVYGSVDPGAPRTGQPVPQVSAPDPIFYPKNGQSAEAIESDRRECNRWATTQPGAMADGSIFQRATLACMEGRGYTVR
ncbi:MAG: hypothetical protein ABI520_07940 [Caldimonas sp.]